jgi:hypothetical protein
MPCLRALASLVPLLLALPLTAAAQPQESALAGVWKDSDRGLDVELVRDAEGLWNGRAAGKLLFEKLRFDAAQGSYGGTLIKPEDGERVAVTVKLTAPDALEAVVRKFIFSKTLRFARQRPPPADGGAP